MQVTTTPKAKPKTATSTYPPVSADKTKEPYTVCSPDTCDPEKKLAVIMMEITHSNDAADKMPVIF